MSDSGPYSDTSGDYPEGYATDRFFIYCYPSKTSTRARLEEVDDAESLEHPIPNPNPRPASPRSLVLSFRSNDKDSYLRSRRSGRDGYRNNTRHELAKFLFKEELEVRKTRELLDVALERLDRESRRAQEAEKRALEVAERFRVVNEARLIAQQEASRLNEELNLYKLELTHARDEIERNSEVFKSLEAQRDDAEASAARARSTARKLREEQIKTRAREEGRLQGFKEGTKRGYEQGKLAAYSRRRMRDGEASGPEDDNDDGPPIVDDIPGGDFVRTEPLDGLPPDMMNFSSPPGGAIPLGPVGDLQGNEPAIPVPPPGTYNIDGRGAQGSRFRENLKSPGMSTLSSLPMSLRPGLQPWPPHPNQGDTNLDHPQVVQPSPSSPRRANFIVPPEGYVPPVNEDNYINIPAPHKFSELPQGDPLIQGRSQEGSSAGFSVPPRPPSNPSLLVRDYTFMEKQRSSPQSLAQSMASTSLSNFDLLTSPKSSRKSALTAIPEVSTSMEMSPGTEGRTRGSVMPEHLSFSAASAGFADGVPGSSMRASTPRDERNTQLQRTRSQDEWRYSNPHEVDEWRKTTADEVRDSLIDFTFVISYSDVRDRQLTGLPS